VGDGPGGRDLFDSHRGDVLAAMIDDKVLHIALWFGGMTVASTLHHIADAFGLNLTQWLKRKFSRTGKSDAKESFNGH